MEQCGTASRERVRKETRKAARFQHAEAGAGIVGLQEDTVCSPSE